MTNLCGITLFTTVGKSMEMETKVIVCIIINYYLFIITFLKSDLLPKILTNL